MRVSIEGVLGSGKSTVLERLTAKGFSTEREAVERHFDVLDLFYRDQARWSFLLQTRIACDYAKTPREGLVVVERSPFSALHVFSHNAWMHGMLTRPEWEGLQSLNERLGWVPDAMVYLRVPPDVSMARTRARGRTCEREIGMEYVGQVHAADTAMLARFRALGKPVCEVDATRDIEEVYAVIEEWLTEIAV